ncbi:MAG: VWA domain-containing protein [Gammaproteobacteria bacterium]|nr:VWA domain-containing protein [Gammaproteobacteria bacterium]
MTVNIDDYRERLQRAAPELKDTLDGLFQDASRTISVAALKDYLDGAAGLAELGRGGDLVITFLEQMPRVAQECGDDIIRDCLNAALKLSSMTSGEVIKLMLSSLPTASRRLGDPELLRQYLTLIHQMSTKAPRGLRPMLNHIDELLSKLTLSGLKRWCNFGIEAYRRDLGSLTAYFDLATQDSLAVLQKERRGTLFVDKQRKLNFYLRALWGRDFFLRPTAADHSDFRPYLGARTLHLPDAVDDVAGISGLELYRACAAHMAAHIVYTPAALSATQLSPAQMFFIGLIEDARVEYNAVCQFPGLQRLWGSLLALGHEAEAEHPTVVALEQAAQLLLDANARGGDAAINEFAARFHSEVAAHPLDTTLSWHYGIELYNLFSGRQAMPSLRILQRLRIPYRDDNRFIWDMEQFRFDKDVDYLAARGHQVRRNVNVMEMVNEVDCELAGDDAQEVWRLSTAFWLDQEAKTINELEGREPISDPFHYPEWDYQIQLHRPDWATVYERRPTRGDAQLIEDILVEHRPVTSRIRQIIDMLQPEGIIRDRRLEDGDEIDINAAIDAMIDIRMGRSPDPRITMRNIVKNRDLCVVVLLDLSESTNETVEGSDKTILALTREACTLVATAINGIGDPFAIHGFASDGRHDVQYFRFKDFGQKLDDEVKARLAGMRGGLSTRMGAAMRHAGQHLLHQAQRRKLLLLVTDGEPADIDERDPQHLRQDAKKAVEELYSKGVMTYCLTLDPRADDYVTRIFGRNNYTIIDHVQRLPEKLPALFATLTR